MSCCPCCGEPKKLSASTYDRPGAQRSAPEAPSGDLWADDTLVGVCRHVTQLAIERRAIAIEVADLVMALAARSAGRVALAAAGLEPEEAVARASAVAAALPHRAAVHAADVEMPSFATDTLAVLKRGEALARRRGADTVTAADVCQVLAKQSSDLAGARFLGSVSPRPSAGAERGSPEAGHRRRTRNRTAGHPATYDRPMEMSVSDRMIAAAPSDPFQLRVNPDAPLDETALRASDNGERRFDPTARHAVARDEPTQPVHAGCDKRDLERRLSELAEQNAKLTRAATGHRELSEARLSDLARDVAALQLAMQEALAALENRLATRVKANTPVSDNGRDTDRRLATIEEALRRLEELVARQGSRGSTFGARSSSSSSRSARTSRGLRSLSRRRRQRSSRSSYSSHSDGASRGSRGDRTTGGHDQIRAEQDHTATNVMAFDAVQDEGDPAAKRFYLTMSDEIVCAPSIGPRTAARLNAQDIDTVADLLAADAGELAERIDSRYITTQTIEDWQMQSRLVCTIPWLRGTHAQLLVGAGYTSAKDIADASGDELSADILKFAQTRDGQRVLRNGPPPPIERIAKWAEFATLAETDRAA